MEFTAETPETIREICRDAYAVSRREVEPGVFRDVEVPNWPLPYRYEDFVITRLPRLDQQDVWNAFLRTLRVSDVVVCDTVLRDELKDLTYDKITGPRNSFLYKAAYWPTPDLIADANAAGFDALLSVPLDPDEQGFLLRLSCDVYRVFEQLVADLAAVSGPIKDEILESRVMRNPQLEELIHYNGFLAGVAAASGSQDEPTP